TSVRSTPGPGPEVSIITAFRDAGAFLKEAIESVLGQTFSNWELILVDDGSVDVSTETALQYAQSWPEKIRYLEHTNHSNRGLAASRNLGLRNASAKFVGIIDGDDVWLPTKLADQLAMLRAFPTAGFLFGCTGYWNGSSRDASQDSLAVPNIRIDRL